jgi:hypothetical protein
VQVLLCFIWQCAAATLLYEYRKDIQQPFKMWLYPLPALVAFVLWLYIFFSGPRQGIYFSFAYLAAAVMAFAAFERTRGGPAQA